MLWLIFMSKTQQNLASCDIIAKTDTQQFGKEGEVVSSNIFSRNFWMITGINFILYCVYMLLIVILVEYSVQELHASDSTAGLIAGIYIFAGFIGRLWAGRYSMRLPLLKLLRGGLLLSLACCVLYFFSHDIWTMFLIRILHGISFGIVSTIASTMIVYIVPANRRGEGIGYYMLSMTLATAAGPFIGMGLQSHFSYPVIFLTGTLITAFGVVLTFLLRYQQENASKKDAKVSGGLSSLLEKKVVPLGMIGFFTGLCYSSIVSFLSPYLKEIGIFSVGSLFFIVYAAVIFLTRPFVGRASDRHPLRIVYVLFVFFALGLFTLGGSQSAWWIILAAVFVGIGYGSFIPCMQNLAIRGIDVPRIGVATATSLAIFDMGMGFGPYLLGYLIQPLGYRNLYFLTAAIIIADLLFFRVWQRHHIHLSVHEVIHHIHQ